MKIPSPVHYRALQEYIIFLGSKHSRIVMSAFGFAEAEQIIENVKRMREKSVNVNYFPSNYCCILLFLA